MTGIDDVSAQLAEVYAEVPPIECRGLCHDSCGSLGTSAAERAVIRDRGVELPPLAVFPAGCPALTILKRCSVYDVRPLICRLWGVAEGMPCTYGCRPAGGLLPDSEAYRLLARAGKIRVPGVTRSGDGR